MTRRSDSYKDLPLFAASRDLNDSFDALDVNGERKRRYEASRNSD